MSFFQVVQCRYRLSCLTFSFPFRVEFAARHSSSPALEATFSARFRASASRLIKCASCRGLDRAQIHCCSRLTLVFEVIKLSFRLNLHLAYLDHELIK